MGVTRIQRKRTKGYRLPPNAVYVGRPTKWGNPFVVGTDWMCWAALGCGYRADRAGQRVAAVALYKAWITGTKVAMGPIGKDASRPGFEYDDGTYSTVDAMCVGIARFGMTIANAQPAIPDSPPPVDELRGKDLACFCALDQPCHADVLLEWANAEVPA